MAINGAGAAGRRSIRWRAAGWSLAVLALLAPLAAMRFTDAVRWSAGDFLFAALLIGGVGATIELTVRAARSLAFRGGVASALAAGVLIVWATGAVGMVGSEDDPYNLLFLGVILIALAGSVVARFRAGGMAMAMAAAAAAHLAVAIGGTASDPRGGIVSALLAAPWLLSALLFALAARAQKPPAGP